MWGPGSLGTGAGALRWADSCRVVTDWKCQQSVPATMPSNEGKVISRFFCQQPSAKTVPVMTRVREVADNKVITVSR